MPVNETLVGLMNYSLCMSFVFLR